MRRLDVFVRKYGPEVGPRLYHLLQSQAAHAGVSARLRRKIDVLTGRAPAPAPASEAAGRGTVEALPLFPDLGTEPPPRHAPEPDGEPVAVGA
jgi:hypothetical protein